MNKKIQIGISDFRELIEGGYYFVDKSLLIKEFVDSGAKVMLTLRPRRFGKTLNLSMLRYFFDMRLKKKPEEQDIIKSDVKNSIKSDFNMGLGNNITNNINNDITDTRDNLKNSIRSELNNIKSDIKNNSRSDITITMKNNSRTDMTLNMKTNIKKDKLGTLTKDSEESKNTFQRLNSVSDNVKKIFIDLDNEENDSRVLFQGLNIEKEEEVMKLQGQYPTLFVTFKDIRYSSYEDFKDGIRVLLSQLYEEHEYLLESYKLSDVDKEIYKKFMRGDISIGYLCQGISLLMKFMYKHYEEKVILLIDEYDTPIEEVYIEENYSEIIELMRNILTSALKDNTYLEKAFITGVLKLEEDSIFSGLNNLETNTILGYKFNDKFGFTQEEMNELIENYEVTDEIQELKRWYNGYVFGDKIICNPWSILNYLNKRKEGFLPYWINSSTNKIIKKLLLKNIENTRRLREPENAIPVKDTLKITFDTEQEDTKLINDGENIEFDLKELLKGNTITKTIDYNISVDEFKDSSEAIWSVLVLTGYLKAIRIKNVNGRIRCELKIPNEEIRMFFENV